MRDWSRKKIMIVVGAILLLFSFIAVLLAWQMAGVNEKGPRTNPISKSVIEEDAWFKKMNIQ